MKLMNKSRPIGLPKSVFLPFPELVEPGIRRGPWKIVDSNGRDDLPTNGITDKKGRRVFVPLDPYGGGVSDHELAHIHWSPERLPRVRHPMILLQAVEDARINLGLERIGLKVMLDREQLAYVAHLAASDAKSGDVASTLVRAIASIGTGAADVLYEELLALPGRASEFGIRWIEQVTTRLEKARAKTGDQVAPFRVARSIAKELARDLERNGLLPKDFAVREVGCCHLVMDTDELGSADHSRGMTRYERYLRRTRGRGGRGKGDRLEAGEMTIARPPLPIRQPALLRAGVARTRAAMEGTRITRPDRFLIDRSIFTRKTRGDGATVLVDTSGSMSLNVEQVESIVRAAGGAAVVAIYSGRDDVGELRIVARGEFRAKNDALKPFGSGNIVDLPALEWLAKQPEPRLWVSDGCVTACGDEGSEAVLASCLEVAKRGRIERVENAGEAIEAIEKMYSK